MRTRGRTWRLASPTALAVCLSAGLAAPALAAGAATWLPAGQLSNAGQNVGVVAVAADAQGTVIAAWSRSDGTNMRVEATVRPPGGPFGPLQFLSAPGADATMPAAAFDAQGNAIVAWSRNGIIQAASRPAGGSFGAGQDLSLDGEGADQPQVTFNSQGDAVVLWR